MSFLKALLRGLARRQPPEPGPEQVDPPSPFASHDEDDFFAPEEDAAQDTEHFPPDPVWAGILAGDWHHPASSNVWGWRYLVQDGTLEVVFRIKRSKSGRASERNAYAYYEVPQEIALRLAQAPSAGKFHHRHLKGVYAFSRFGFTVPTE